jgi:hypothetical protein
MPNFTNKDQSGAVTMDRGVAEFPQGIYTEAESTPRERCPEHWREHADEVESALRS